MPRQFDSPVGGPPKIVTATQRLQAAARPHAAVRQKPARPEQQHFHPPRPATPHAARPTPPTPHILQTTPRVLQPKPVVLQAKPAVPQPTPRAAAVARPASPNAQAVRPAAVVNATAVRPSPAPFRVVGAVQPMIRTQRGGGGGGKRGGGGRKNNNNGGSYNPNHDGNNQSEGLSIPSKIRLRDGVVDLEAFDLTARGKQKYANNGWYVERDNSARNGHGGSYWKLYNSHGVRVGTLSEDGTLLRG